MQSIHIAATIKDLCKSKGITISTLLSSCNLTKSFIYDLEKRAVFPSCDKLARIADYLECSVDYLLGRTDEPSRTPNIINGNVADRAVMHNSQETASRIKSLAKSKGISLKVMLSECNLGINAISQMSKGSDMLSKNLARIADYLDCSVDYLLGRTEEIEKPTPVPEDGLEKILMQYVANLTLDQQKMLLAQMQVMKESQKQPLPSSVQG